MNWPPHDIAPNSSHCRRAAAAVEGRSAGVGPSDRVLVVVVRGSSERSDRMRKDKERPCRISQTSIPPREEVGDGDGGRKRKSGRARILWAAGLVERPEGVVDAMRCGWVPDDRRSGPVRSVLFLFFPVLARQSDRERRKDDENDVVLLVLNQEEARRVVRQTYQGDEKETADVPCESSTHLKIPLELIPPGCQWAAFILRVQAILDAAVKTAGPLYILLALSLLRCTYTQLLDVGDDLSKFETASGIPQIRWCKRCRRSKPPMTHHCHICKRCILKMDHHCRILNMWTSTHLLLSLPKRTVFYLLLCCRLLSSALCHASSDGIFTWSSPRRCSFTSGPPFFPDSISRVQTTIDFYSNRQRRRDARRSGQVWVNEFDMGKIQNLRNVFETNSSGIWWLRILLPFRASPKGDGVRFPSRYGSSDAAFDANHLHHHDLPSSSLANGSAPDSRDAITLERVLADSEDNWRSDNMV
ncbi:hypothetical protein AXG93_48s1280 [Marchantia polymorpha subsp. ruderalis]|uniref:S-acyltransferase n=1 Tax=Marchantia polymorpha subsp. ruderalis TaxID=1480154 RepID=A0A176VVE8_MARPO|nr:hypothetical protein AXG93_48s1280 [Marchantia polymorpha subsp. ruderalis]